MYMYAVRISLVEHPPTPPLTYFYIYPLLSQALMDLLLTNINNPLSELWTNANPTP